MAIGESIDAATAALRARWGDALSIGEAVELGGSGRSTVARVTLTGADAPASSAVIKVYPEGATTWADEAAGAAYLGRVGAGLVPDLLAVDQQRRIVVITDLGDHPQLSDALLADDPELAERALLDWADSLGDLLSRTFGGREEYQRIRADLGLPPRTEFVPEQAFREPCAELADLVQAKLGIAPPAGLDAELRDAVDLLADREHEVVTPADLCPDNNLITPDRSPLHRPGVLRLLPGVRGGGLRPGPVPDLLVQLRPAGPADGRGRGDDPPPADHPPPAAGR